MEDKNYNYKAELEKHNFTSDYIRVAEKIYNNVPAAGKEIKLFVDFMDYSLYAGIDGKQEDELVEYKTGAGLWSQKQADESDQITHYSLCWLIKYNTIPEYRLISISNKNGKHVILKTKRTQEQIDNWKTRLNNFKNELQYLGWWDKKLKFEDRINV